MTKRSECFADYDSEDNYKNNEKNKRANLERALFTLKGIAQGKGCDPRIYAQNTLDDIGEKY